MFAFLIFTNPVLILFLIYSLQLASVLADREKTELHRLTQYLLWGVLHSRRRHMETSPNLNIPQEEVEAAISAAEEASRVIEVSGYKLAGASAMTWSYVQLG